ncbi:MAG: alpha/beta fold hydrolase [Polyangiaceae bacterium]
MSVRLRILAAAALLGLGLSGCLGFHPGPSPDEPKAGPLGPMTWKTVEGARVRYVDLAPTEVDSGTPVVFIHGFAAVLESFLPVIQEVRKNHRVIAMDLKGFGLTDRPEGDYSPPAQAKLVTGLMDQLGVEKADLVAHSWGSSIALQIALDDPARIGKIALYDAWVYEEQIPTFFLWSRADGIGEALFSLYYDELPDEKIALGFYDKSLVTEALVEGVEKELEAPGNTAAALAAVRGQRYAEVQKRYPTIQQPVLLLWGREDKVTTLNFGERLSKELPNARLVVYPQCGHFPMIEAVAPSTREVVAFLAAVPAPAANPPKPIATPVPAPAPNATDGAAPPPDGASK